MLALGLRSCYNTTAEYIQIKKRAHFKVCAFMQDGEKSEAERDHTLALCVYQVSVKR